MKIDRYQGWMNNNNDGAIHDHQTNKCVVQFFNVPKDKKEMLLITCLNILNQGDVDD